MPMLDMRNMAPASPMTPEPQNQHTSANGPARVRSATPPQPCEGDLRALQDHVQNMPWGPRRNSKPFPNPPISTKRMLLAALAATSAARPPSVPAAGLTLQGAVPTVSGFGPPIQEAIPTQMFTAAATPVEIAQTSVAPPAQTSGRNAFKRDDFQKQSSVGIGSAALVLATASLPFTAVLGRRRKQLSAQTDAEAENARATGPTPTQRATRSPVAPASAIAETQDTSPPPPSRRISEMLAHASSVALRVWKTTDVYTGLQVGDDKQLIDDMTSPPDGRMSLPDRKAELVAWADAIQGLDLPDKLKQHFDRSIEDTIAAIDRLINEANPWSRGTKLVAQAILCTPLPIVLPLLAAPIEREQAVVIIASCAKTTILRAGLGRRGASHDNAINNLYLNRDYANVIQSIALSLNLFRRTHAIANNPVYNIGAAVVSASILAYTFYPDQIKSLPGGIRRLLNQAASYITGKPLPQRDRTARVGGVGADAVSDETKASLAAHAAEIFGAREALAAQRSHFTDSGKNLSDTGDWQFGQMLKAYSTLATELGAFTSANERPGERPHDPDRAAKLALAALSGAICIGVTVMFKQNQITAVDMGVDALFNIYNGLNNALDPDVSWQGALNAFKNWTSLSLVLGPLQGANLAADNFVEKSGRNMGIGVAALTAANLLAAGPSGAAVKAIVTKAVSRTHERPSQESLSVEMAGGAERAAPGAATRSETGATGTAAVSIDTSLNTSPDAAEWTREMMDYIRNV